MKIEITTIDKQTDQQGALLEIFKENGLTGGVKQVYYLITRPGAVSGNHYHLHNVEWLSVIKGRAKVLCEDLVTKERQELLLSDEKPMVVKIHRFISHAIKNVGQEDLFLLVAASEVFDPANPDALHDNLL